MRERTEQTKEESSITKRILSEDMLWGLAAIDEDNFRRLYVAAQYHQFKTHIAFGDAQILPEIINYVKQLNGTAREGYFQPTRRQRLGKLHELKVDLFLEFSRSLKSGTDCDIFERALTSEPGALIYGDDVLSPIVATTVKIPQSEWNYIVEPNHSLQEVSITLPQKIDAQYTLTKNSLSPNSFPNIDF